MIAPMEPSGPDWDALAPHWRPGHRSAEDDAAAERELAAMRATAERVAGGGIRAAVLGVNDGLVTNLCLILGVAGAAAEPGTVRLSGLASLVAGALSMAAGEWVSVRGQAEVARGMEQSLHEAWRLSPPVVLGHLTASLRERGLDRETAVRASRGVMTGRAASRAGTRILAGVSAEDAGSPVVAAVSSLLLFAVGALLPLLPWFFAAGDGAVLASVVITALASLVVGGALGRSAGRGAVRTAGRQLLIVALASLVTYGLGRLAGTSVM
ncbi:VIT1/CCC1 transporter family protein [Kitasatospora sp. NPDC096147]|uniref:VIT1/CCC1 transporter family protein n=1 Tax=Kitasatospora sp. NPDC096147 TaxID=3364093 RepID=UPI00381BABB1